MKRRRQKKLFKKLKAGRNKFTVKELAQLKLWGENPSKALGR